MDPACFTTAQRLSCKMMNPDLFKPSPAVQPPAKPNRSKSEHVKTEIAQVVVDAKTGRSYCKGKLLGKVPLFIYIYIYALNRFWINGAFRVSWCMCLVLVLWGAPEPLDPQSAALSVFLEPTCWLFHQIHLIFCKDNLCNFGFDWISVWFDVRKRWMMTESMHQWKWCCIAQDHWYGFLLLFTKQSYSSN